MSVSVRIAGLVALAVALTYAVFLGWDQQLDVDPGTGRMSGPYSAAQVVGCAVVYLLVVAAGATRSARATVAVAPLTFTLLWSVDAATDPRGDGLWPIGAALVAVGTAIGASLAATAGVALAVRRAS